jgi:hypothetical protein
MSKPDLDELERLARRQGATTVLWLIERVRTADRYRQALGEILMMVNEIAWEDKLAHSIEEIARRALTEEE